MCLKLGIVVFGRRGFLEDEHGMSRCITRMTYVIINKDDDDDFCPQTTDNMLSRQRERERDIH